MSEMTAPQYVYVYATYAEQQIGKSDPAFVPRFAISVATRGKAATRTIALVDDVKDAEVLAVEYARAHRMDCLMLPSAGAVAFNLTTGYAREPLKPNTRG